MKHTESNVEVTCEECPALYSRYKLLAVHCDIVVSETTETIHEGDTGRHSAVIDREIDSVTLTHMVFERFDCVEWREADERPRTSKECETLVLPVLVERLDDM